MFYDGTRSLLAMLSISEWSIRQEGDLKFKMTAGAESFESKIDPEPETSVVGEIITESQELINAISTVQIYGQAVNMCQQK